MSLPSNDNEDRLIRDNLSSILQGYSVAFPFGKKVFIKHFGFYDSIESDIQYQITFNKCVKNGVFTESQKVKLAIKNNLWSEEEDRKIASISLAISSLTERRSKAALPSQKNALSKEIDDNYLILSELRKKRGEIIGVTAESIANQRSEDYYIYKSFFTDKNFDVPLYDDDYFDIISEEDMEILKSCYFESLKFILNGNIKKIAISNRFLSLMGLTDNYYEVLGKPFSNYTFYQMDLLTYGKLYKHILNMEPKPPVEIRHDPDKLEQWLDSSTSTRKIIGNSDSSGQVLIGATDGDIKELFKNEEVVNIDTEIKKKGRLSMQEMMKLHGF